MTIDEILKRARVIPVIELPELACAAPLAQALAAGGLRVVELTLRTSCALDAMRSMHAAIPDLIVGMGTVRTGDDVRRSIDAGADFLVSPGASPRLLQALVDSGAAALPGVATASEAMAASEAGFQAQKFFPAEQAGGVGWLKAMYGPLPDVMFCPTGGIGAEKIAEYLALPNVAWVGGSWIADKGLLSKRDWKSIEGNARRAAGL